MFSRAFKFGRKKIHLIILKIYRGGFYLFAVKTEFYLWLQEQAEHEQ